MKILWISLFVVFVSAIINIVPVRSVSIVSAKCPECMCVNVPQCGDVILVKRGIPFTSYQQLANEKYVEEPFKSTNESKLFVKNIFLNSFIVIGFSALIIGILKKNNKL